MRSWGAQPRVGVIVEHREALLPFVSAGIGAAIVDRRAAEAAEGLVMRSFEPPVVRLFGLVYDAVRQTPVAEAFAAVARAHSTVVGLYRADPAEPDDVTETLGRAPG